MKKISIIFTIICLILMSFIGVGSLSLDDRVLSSIENRTLCTYPQYSLEKMINGEFFNEYETYSLDQMVGRDNFVNLLNTLKVIEGKKEINGIIVAGENVLIKKGYYSSISNRVDVKGNLVADMIGRIKKSVDDYGGQTIYMHVMHQSEFYKDLLPSCYRSLTKDFDKYNSSLINEVSKTGVTVVNCNPVLTSHKNEYLYFKTDHHWTPKGAYYAYKELIKNIDSSIEIEPYENMNVKRDNKQFLGAMSGLIGTTWFKNNDFLEIVKRNGTPKYSRKTLKNGRYFYNSAKLYANYDEKYCKYENIEQTNYGIDNFYTSQPEKKDILIIGYSYKQALIPYALKDFNRVMLLDPRTYDGSINDYIKSAKADYVVVLRDDLWEGNKENIATVQ